MGNLQKYIYVFVLVAIHVTFSTADGLENFIRMKMDSYPSWLQNNRLDPSPYVAGPTVFTYSNSIVSLNCTLRNHNMKGHSRLKYTSIDADLQGRHFSVGFTFTENITFSGDYTATVKYGDTTRTATGPGWYIIVPQIRVFDAYMEFATQPNGYITISYYSLEDINFYENWYPAEVYFRNLVYDEKDELYPILRTAFLKGFENYLDAEDIGEHPIRSLYLRYWQKVLQETTLEDIIATTLPPVTSSTKATTYRTSTSTTTRRYGSTTSRTVPSRTELFFVFTICVFLYS